MGLVSKFSPSIFLSIALSLLIVPTKTHDEGFISVVISNEGLNFAKDLLIEKAISSIIPLQLPQIEKSVKIPLLANLSMKWRYSYKNWLGEISDNGNASIEVEDMEVGVNVTFKDQEGTLRLSLLESGCHVKDISINLDGGESWLYQVFVYIFEGKIRSAVEDALPKKISEGISKLDSILQSLPKEIRIYDVAAMNVTFVDKPALSNSSIEFDINGLFLAYEDIYLKDSVDLVVCKAPVKMVEISLHENVFNSFSFVFFNENQMRWIIRKLPDQSLLNTTRWRYIVPQLYKLYPDDALELNIYGSSPPKIKVESNDIDVTIYLDVIINVMDAAEVVPVACMSLEISTLCSPKILGNKLVGTLKLKDFTSVLKWSRIGNFHMHLVQSMMSVILKTVILPYANLHLWKGLPLPLLHGFILQNADILSTDSRVVICSDVAYAERWYSVVRGLVSS